MNEFFTLQHDGPVAHLQLNRPERMNTMTPAFFPALRNAARGLQDDGSTRALVISSTGKHFSAGMALDVFAGAPAPAASPASDRRDPNGDSQRQAVGALMQMLDTGSARARLSFQESLRRLVDCFSAIDEARFPVICAVLCAAFEATIGASPGKVVVGARVLCLRPVKPAVEGKREPGEPVLLRAVRLSVGAAVARNAIRWLMPPLGLALVADNNWRHPGDMLAGSVVVVRAADEPAEGQTGTDEPGSGDSSGDDNR